MPSQEEMIAAAVAAIASGSDDGGSGTGEGEGRGRLVRGYRGVRDKVLMYAVVASLLERRDR